MTKNLFVKIVLNTIIVNILLIPTFAKTNARPMKATQKINKESYMLPSFNPDNIDSINSKFEEVMHIDDITFSEQLTNYKKLLQENNSLRYLGLTFIEDLLKRKSTEGDSFHLNGTELDKLSKGVKMLLDLRKSLYKNVHLYSVIDAFNDYNTLLQAGNILLNDEKQATFKSGKPYTVNTGTDKGRLFAKKLGLSLHAAITLYDNYFLMIQLFENIDQIRRVIDQGNKAYGIPAGQLNEISDRIDDVKLRASIVDSLKLFDRYVSLDAGDSELKEIVSLINNSYSTALFRKSITERSWEMLAGRVKGLSDGYQDAKKRAVRTSTNSLSKVFGNAVGMIEFRKGYMYNNVEIENLITPQLKPLDILLEKTPFRPTDRFIPGHWGHVAIWIGSLDELKNSGVWELVELTYEWQNIPTSNQQEIKEKLSSGHLVLEALRPGVELNSIAHFLNIDDFASIRPIYTELSSDLQKAITIARALGNYGKAYDFNFDVQTIDKIVCSELAYQTYIEIDWPTEKTVGRYSITPDQVAVKALEDYPFQIVELWHQGGRVEGDQVYLSNAYKMLSTTSDLTSLNGNGNWSPIRIENN